MAKELRICFLGESFVNGTGDPECLGWTGRVCAAANHQGHEVTYYNLGIRRETSTELLARWQSEVSRRLPPGVDGRLVFSFGVNDTTWDNDQPRVAVADSLENARQILTQAQRSHPVLMVGPALVADAAQNQRILSLSAAFAELCDEIQVPFLEIARPLQDSPVWIPEAIANDGAHPRAAGYAELATWVQSWSAWQTWFSET